MAEVKWIKLSVDMFDNRKIKHLRKLPDGNNIVLVWVMLLTMAGRCNAEGMIFLTENIPYSTKMLADELDIEENTIKMALSSFELMGMITRRSEGLGEYIMIKGWEEYQSLDKLAKLREQNRLAQQRHRDKVKALGESSDSNITVSLCHDTDIDIDIDKDIDIEKKSNKRKAFIPPTLEEVKAYCKERGNNVDPERWLAFYESKGFMIGKNKMKDWKAGVRTWEGHMYGSKDFKRQRLSDIDERQNDYKAIMDTIPDPLDNMEEDR